MEGEQALKIAMFGQKKIPSREGGVEIVVAELSRRMTQLGHQVCCYNRKGHHVSGAEFDEARAASYEGVKLKYVPTIEKKGLAAASSSFFAALCCAFGSYDVVHIHAEGPAVFSFIPKFFGKRVVVTIHGLDWQRAKWKGGLGEKYIHLGEKMAVKYADEIIVLSRAVQDYFMQTYGRSTRFIPNGITRPEPEQAQLISEKLNIEAGKYILYLGRLVPEKGAHYLIQAFRELDTDKKLIIAGGSSDTEGYMLRLKELAEGDGRIVFTGFVQGKILRELYSNAYLYVLPSDLEGMPLSLLEALSYGNCCVVSDIPECTEVVEDKALCFPKGDVGALRDLLHSLLNEPETVERYRAEASNFICGKYSWDEVLKKTLELYIG